ncbi:hypothetical protein M9H77_26185 [Catharanthus roseus]|uniref:Uncharacterized protein n=1 Tax=Catharanthus roseus TaxID=4058 RepID=A0ACC0ABN8_CATRO|nr:hypothetical protein M9H77_26185 [Catharanthus roseus]
MASKGKDDLNFNEWDENGIGRRVDEQGDGVRRRNMNAGEGCSRGVGIKGMLCTNNLLVDDVMKRTFGSVEDAETKWHCNSESCCSGKWLEKEDRERNHKVETRVKCGACFRIKYDEARKAFLKYFLGKYDRPELTWTVELARNSGLMEYSCMKLESKGLPYSHMFRCMVMEYAQSIPSPCILERWARSFGDRRNTGGKISETVSEMVGYGMLSGLCGILYYHASKSAKQTSYLRGAIEREIEQLKARNNCP